jgi:hypothetical protein
MLYTVLAVTSLLQQSVTIDEFAHLPAGYYSLRTGSTSYARLNPPVMNQLSALPVVLFEAATGQAPALAPAPPPLDFWPNGYVFMRDHSHNYHALYCLARAVTVVHGLLLAGLLYLWARELTPRGPTVGASLVVALLLLLPDFLAHSQLVTTDLGAAFYGTLALYALHRFLREPTRMRAAAFGMSAGLALSVKVSTVIVLLTAGLLVPLVAWRADRGVRRRIAAGLLIAGFAILLVIGTVYRFEATGRPMRTFTFDSRGLNLAQRVLPGALPVPVPSDYVMALDRQWRDSERGDPSYLLGRPYFGGRWEYFLVLAAAKTPLPLLAIVALAVWVAWRGKGPDGLTTAVLLVPPVVLLLMLSFSQKQLGLRMLLPAVPPLLLWVALAIQGGIGTGRLRWPVAALVAWYAWETLAIHPHHLSYFNQAFGGPSQGWRVAVDSNLDWGQDLPALRKLMDRHGIARLQLYYFGFVDPGLYGIDYEVPGRPRPGWIAVSASLLARPAVVYDHGRLLPMRARVDPAVLGPPVDSAGYSIYLFRIRP